MKINENYNTILLYLVSIDECVDVAAKYINNEIYVNDIDELITGLKCIIEDTKDIRKSLDNIIAEYENKLIGFDYE